MQSLIFFQGGESYEGIYKVYNVKSSVIKPLMYVYSGNIILRPAAVHKLLDLRSHILYFYQNTSYILQFLLAEKCSIKV